MYIFIDHIDTYIYIYIYTYQSCCAWVELSYWAFASIPSA